MIIQKSITLCAWPICRMLAGIAIAGIAGMGCTGKSAEPSTATAAPAPLAPVTQRPTTQPAPAEPATAPVAVAVNDGRITPAQTKQLLDAKADFLLVDCRTPLEVASGKIEGSTAIPLHEIEKREPELAPWKDKQIVVYRRSGPRSAKFAETLRAKGYRDVKVMTGGITAWNKEVPSTRPT